MGLEAYLFKVQFNPPVKKNEIINLFQKSGMTYLKNKTKTNSIYHSYYFEKRTDQGLTECHCLSKDNILPYCSIRFSILSPHTVIEQTFDIFKQLNKFNQIKVFDLEIENQIYLELVKRKIIKANFQEIKGTKLEDEVLHRLHIPIDPIMFRENKNNIIKKNMILKNETGKIIESDDTTIKSIEKDRKVEDYFGWIKYYL
jgi:hypothetical protein